MLLLIRVIKVPLIVLINIILIIVIIIVNIIINIIIIIISCSSFICNDDLCSVIYVFIWLFTRCNLNLLIVKLVFY